MNNNNKIINNFEIKSKSLDNLSIPKSVKISWLAHLFGCWHKQMGTPFTRGSQTYSTCRECGACRKFDMIRWKSVGPYFYNPILGLYEDSQILIKVCKTL
ncbi:MAG TPA: hypothetical protein PKY82_20455 [Pyrinomonadaceae bacterium]|nr:hypothetical protein [Pyrinomonadaceae bacterium]